MYSRRRFLVHATWLAMLPASVRALTLHSARRVESSEFSASELASLAAAMDEIIPPAAGMPSASQAGGLQYLQYLGWQYPEIRQDITHALKSLEQVSVSQLHVTFSKLRSDQHIHVLTEMEKAEASTFSAFVAYVYEAYYTDPRVLDLISCAPSTIPAEDDEVLLAPVRKLTHLYRQVP